MSMFRVRFTDGREWWVQADSLDEVLLAARQLPGGEDRIASVEMQTEGRTPETAGLAELAHHPALAGV